jgi:hypothetical protein
MHDREERERLGTAVPRYRLECLDCGRGLPLHRPTPRVPLCDRCVRQRQLWLEEEQRRRRRLRERKASRR